MCPTTAGSQFADTGKSDIRIVAQIILHLPIFSREQLFRETKSPNKKENVFFHAQFEITREETIFFFSNQKMKTICVGRMIVILTDDLGGR